uniref:Uncharacterized protein n=1 Tax=Heterorhabditis bacteriophora TaxID=37862 RepID=A0A1I7WVX2_HETBA
MDSCATIVIENSWFCSRDGNIEYSTSRLTDYHYATTSLLPLA